MVPLNKWVLDENINGVLNSVHTQTSITKFSINISTHFCAQFAHYFRWFGSSGIGLRKGYQRKIIDRDAIAEYGQNNEATGFDFLTLS